MKDHDQDDIKALFVKIANGDQKAFDRLFLQQYDRIYSTALAYGKVQELAEDIAQQVFLKVWENRASLITIEQPLAWLQMAARYAIRDVFDRRAVREKYLKMAVATFRYNPDSPEEVLIRRQKMEILQGAVAALTGRPAEVYRLSREEGMTYEQIAVFLGIGKESVKEYMTTALKKVKAFLLKHRDALMSVIIFFW